MTFEEEKEQEDREALDLWLNVVGAAHNELDKAEATVPARSFASGALLTIECLLKGLRHVKGWETK